MKILKYLFIIRILIALVAIILRLTHIISSSTFGLLGIVFFLLANRSSTSETEEQPITDLKEYINPIKKRYDIVRACTITVGILYLAILIFSIFHKIITIII